MSINGSSREPRRTKHPVPVPGRSRSCCLQNRCDRRRRARAPGPRAAAERSAPPAEGEAAAAVRRAAATLSGCQQAPGRQPFRAEPPEVARAAEQAGMPETSPIPAEEPAVAVLRASQRRRPEIRHDQAPASPPASPPGRCPLATRRDPAAPPAPPPPRQPQRIEDARAQQLGQRRSGGALRGPAPEDKPEIAVRARPGADEIAAAPAATISSTASSRDRQR